MSQTCADDKHTVDLAEEGGILYLTCTKCFHTRFLHEKDDPRSNPAAYQAQLNKELGIT